MQDKIPVTVLTGFLGAGKTTLLNHALQEHPESRWLVIINEFGAVGVDHDLVVQSEFETESASSFVQLSSGCLCCTVRGDLTKTLADAIWRFSRAGMRWFDHVVIETTGLADPAPIIQTLTTQPTVTRHYALATLVCALDVPNATVTLESTDEAAKQVAVADAVVLTKSDLATPSQLETTRARVRHLNPAAQVCENIYATDNFSIHDLLITPRFSPSINPAAADRWLSHELFEHAAVSNHDHHAHGAEGHDVNRHDENIRAVCLVIDEPLSVKVFDSWFRQLSDLRGQDLLRIKGILNVTELQRPMVIHGVQHIWHEPEILPHWPSEARTSRVVFIVRNLSIDALRDSLSSIRESFENTEWSGLSSEEVDAIVGQSSI